MPPRPTLPSFPPARGPTNPRPLSPRIVLVSALALAAVGCGEDRDVSPNFEDRIPAGVTLAQEPDTLPFGDATVLRGSYERSGEPLAGEPVTLAHDTYRFDGQFEPIAKATTDQRGRFEFEVKPAVNTEYRVEAGDLAQTESNDARVIVLPRISVERRERAGGRVRYTTTLTYAPEVQLGGTLVRHYAARAETAARTGSLSLVGTTPPRRVRAGLSRATYELPAFAAGVRYESCVALAPSSGIGAGDSRCAGESLRVDP